MTDNKKRGKDYGIVVVAEGVMSAQELKDQIADLEKLLDAYKNGSISEKYI